MTKQVQLRRGTTAEHQVFTGAVGELTIDTSIDVAVIHDGVTPGGHYLVGTGFGATVSQGIVNKSFIGIGTTTTTGLDTTVGDYQFIVIGDSLLEGSVFARSLDVFYDPSVQRNGTLSDTNPNFITGIATDNIRKGYFVTEDNFIGAGATVTIIGINSIGISIPHTVVGSSITSITFTDGRAGRTNLYFLEAYQSILQEAGITTSYTQDAFINAGIITSAGISTASINNVYVNAGILTTVNITTANISDLFANSGIITSAGISTASINNVYINTGILTTVGVTSARIDNLYVTTGIITGLTADTLLSSNAYIASGIVTNLYTTTLSASNLYSASGIVTNLYTTTLSVNDAYVNSGIITNAGISTANVSNLNVDLGIATGFNIGQSGIVSAYINTGIITAIHVEDTAWINNAKINSGIVTTAGITSSAYVNDLYYNVGLGTTGHITDVWIGNAYVNSGVTTSSRVGFSTLDTAFISTSYTNTGFATYFNATGVGTIQRLESFVGVITYLNGSDINYSGIATIGNMTVGIGNTDVIIEGDARITGVLTVGSASIRISGDDATISGVSTFISDTGTITNLVGSNVQYTGITTFNRVGVSTLTFVGINTQLGNQDKSVRLELSKSGVATNYTIVLPPEPGTAGQVLGVLPGQGNRLGFTTAGLFENRYYVSAQNGDDTFDGKALPVKTIKRAAQLASFDSFIIPGQRYLDAGDLLDANKTFMQEEVIAYLEFNFENIATDYPDYDESTYKTRIGNAIDALAYDVRFGGNSKSIENAFAYWNIVPNPDESYVAGEEELVIFALDYLKFIAQYCINNQTPPTLYQTAVSQSFDYEQISDPLNNNANYFHRSKDARNLIVGNRQEIIDKSLASVAVGVGSTFFFPGETESNERSRYYDSYKLITVNKQEILDKSLASVAVGFPSSWYFPGDSASNGRSRYFDAYRLIVQNKREIVDKSLASVAVYVDSSNQFYFPGDPETNARSRYYDGYRLIQKNKQEIVDKALASVAIGYSDFYVPGEAQTTGRSRYADAYRLIQQNKQQIIDNAWDATVYQYPEVTSTQDKCKRDLGYFIDAISADVFTGGNNYVREFTGFYFVGVGSTSLAGEETQTRFAFDQARVGMQSAVSNQLTIQDLTVTAGPTVYGGGTNVSNTSPSSCTDVQNTIATLTGIATVAIGAGNTSTFPAINLGLYDLWEVGSSVGVGTTNPVGLKKCARDLGYFVDAISADIFTGGNSYSREFTGFYFAGIGTTSLIGEESQSIYAFRSAMTLMRGAVSNQLNYQDRGITTGPALYNSGGATIGVTSTIACTDVQNNVTTLVGIVTVSIGAGNTSSLPAVNYGYFASVGVGSTGSPGGRKCARDLGYLVDAVATDVFTGGNKYSREFALFYYSNGNPTGIGSTERDESVYAFKSASGYMQMAITNNLNYQNLYVTPDPLTNYNRSTLSCANVRSNIDSLVGIVTVTIGAGTSAGITGVNTGFYDADKLLISGSAGAIATSGIGSTSSPGSTKCARDLSLFIEAVSTDVFTGGNNYVRSFTGFYFNVAGQPITNGLVGETTESNYAFEKARDYMKLAVTNQLNQRDLTITADPVTGFNTDPSSCSNVQSTITTLTGIVTTAIGSGSTAGIGTTTNYGYFVVNSTYNVKNVSGFVVGIGSTNVVGGRKCARDLGYIVDAIAQDVAYGTNQHTIYATKRYFDGAGVAKTNGLLGEEVASAYAFKSLGTYAKRAVVNWLNYQDLTIQNDVSVGSTNKNVNVCANTRSTIDSLVGILTGAVLSGSLSGITSVNLGLTDCADVRSAIVNYVGIITTIVGFGTTASPTKVFPQTQSKPVCIIVEAGDYVEDNPILLYDDIAIVGDNLRNTIIRPLNGGKDLFRVRNGVYVTGFAMKDAVDAAGVPLTTWNYAVAFDDPNDPLTSRTGYATKLDKPLITRSPYIQNCSILSFLGANGILVDGAKVQSPNTPLIKQEAETPLVGDQPEQGKSMVAAAFTMVSFGGIGWRTINDGYAQVVSCFQIFCRYGSLTQSGGYLSITNSATNFGLYALRSTGFSPNSFAFDRGRIAATGTSGGLTTLKVVGLGRSDQDLYVARFFNNANQDVTSNFKSSPVTSEFVGTAVTAGGVVNISADTINITSHPFSNGDTVVYFGDEQVIPNRIIGGLVNGNQYYVVYVDSNSFRLSEDDSLTRIVDLTSASTGIHTIQKSTFEFFASSVIERHNAYQELTLATGIGTTCNFVSGREITQTVVGGTALGIAVTYSQTTRKLLVSVELSAGTRRNFAVSNGLTVLDLTDHSGTPIGVGVTFVAGISSYWTTNSKIDTTLAGQAIQGVQNLPETYKLHWHRPSIINSSSHTWEYSGSGIDYNALPQNGGRTVTKSEQVSERGGRVYSSGTNELGDFKIGDFITAFNRTGNIIFNNTVTIGTLDSIRLSLSGGVAIEEFSTDGGMGDNELGGPLNKRVSTQLAIRTFLNNRLGGFIDKSVSTNAIPNAIVQLNAIGQINSDLIPPKVSNYYRTPYNFGRLQLHNQIPATKLGNGDTVVEPQSPYVLVSDTYSQYLVLSNNNVYNFQDGDVIKSVLNQGEVTGIVTRPPYIGVNTNLGITTNTGLTFANVGYGTTGLVRGVALTLKNLTGGSGYSQAGIYTGVRFDTASGIGTGITGTITVSAAGTVQSVAINTGGRYFAVNDILSVNDPTPIGGRSGGSNFTIQIASVETRLYINLLNGVKFAPTTALPDYIVDRNAVAISTNLGVSTNFTFDGTSIDVGGNVDFTNDRITTTFQPFGDGDPVRYSTTGTVISPLIADTIYYVKKVGIGSYTIHSNYAVGADSKIDLTSSGTGVQSFTRVGVVTNTQQLVLVNHGFTQGDPVQINAAAGVGTLPTGLTTGYYYFVGSATTNSFTLHPSRNAALASANGLILDPISLGTNGSGIVSYTKQNISFTDVVNTSGQESTNWAAVGGGDIDASNIISGVVNTTRLAGSGSANNETYLRGDSKWAKAVGSVGFGTTQPVQVFATSTDNAPNGVGINTYYGNVEIRLNRCLPTIDLYSTLGVAQFKTSTFNVGSDGQIQIKASTAGGDVDAATLGGNNSSYHLDVTNHQGTIPVTRGGTGLAAAPPSGSLLIGNGSAYTLTTTPTLEGLLTTQSIAVAANHDISFTTGTWTGEKAGKIQFSSNNLFLQFTTSLIGRNASGTNVFTLGNSGNASFSGTVTGTQLVSNIAQGTAPLTITSTTEVTNLNAQLHNGLLASATYTNGTANIVSRDTSGNFTAGRVTLDGTGSATAASITFTGSTSRWLDFGTTGSAAPAFTTRSAGAKIVLNNAITASAADYAFGIESGSLWSGVPTTSQSFKWYGGTTLAATLTGAGALTLVGALSATTLTSTVATGTAPLTVTSTTTVTNLSADLLDGLNSATAATANTIVARDASGNITGARVDSTTSRSTTHDITADTNNRFQQGTLVLRNASPTIYLRDTDHNVSMIHCNSNIFYVLRGATDSETWTQVNSVWPMQIDLTNNNATFGGTVTASSDVRFKKNIATIQDALDKVLNMRGVTFERLETPGTEIGVIAQEVEEVVPEVVTTDANGHKSVAYANLTALLIEAVKAQQVQIDELRDEIKKLKGE